MEPAINNGGIMLSPTILTVCIYFFPDSHNECEHQLEYLIQTQSI